MNDARWTKRLYDSHNGLEKIISKIVFSNVSTAVLNLKVCIYEYVASNVSTVAKD